MKRRKKSRNQHAITTLDQLKAISDPLRVEILERLWLEPMSPQQMALEMGTPRTRLYHHFRLLEEAGLIAVAHTTRKRGAVERRYASVHAELTVDPKLFGSTTSQEISSAFAGLLRRTATEFHAVERDLDAYPNARILGERLVVRTTPLQVERLAKLLQSFVRKCRRSRRKKGSETYAVTVAFHPVPSRATKTRDIGR